MREMGDSKTSGPELPVSGGVHWESELLAAGTVRVLAQDRIDRAENTLPIVQVGENTDPILSREKLLQQRTEIVSSGLTDLPQLMKKIGTFDRTERACLMHEVQRQLRGSNIGVSSTRDAYGKEGGGSYDEFVFRRPVPGSDGDAYTEIILGFDGQVAARHKEGRDGPVIQLNTDRAAREMSVAIQLFQALDALDRGKTKIAEEAIRKVFSEAYSAAGWGGVHNAINLLKERCDVMKFTLVDSRILRSSPSPVVPDAFPLVVTTLLGRNRIEITVTESKNLNWPSFRTKATLDNDETLKLSKPTQKPVVNVKRVD